MFDLLSRQAVRDSYLSLESDLDERPTPYLDVDSPAWLHDLGYFVLRHSQYPNGTHRSR